MTARILVTGSRDWTDRARIESVLDQWFARLPDAVLVHGGCRGADQTAAMVWASWGLRTEAHPADWSRHGRAAGPIRNQHMVSLGAVVCLAFLLPHSRGTAHCATAAEHAGIPTYRFR